MTTEFIHINQNWNAEPNAPEERIEVLDNHLSLSFVANPWAYEGFEEDQRLELRFYGCSRWRLGKTNDEGWYSGQCRFSSLAPKWGEFYEVKGNLLLNNCPDDWHNVNQGGGGRHFLFYLRDSMFECNARSFELIR